MEKEINKYESDEAKFERVRLEVIMLPPQQRISLGAEIITGSFTWESTKEGQEYWEAVRDRLWELSRGIKEVKKKNGKRKV